MKLLLRQHKHVLLGRSDVSGWGAFVKARARYRVGCLTVKAAPLTRLGHATGRREEE